MTPRIEKCCFRKTVDGWMHLGRDFIPALEHFWNSWASLAQRRVPDCLWFGSLLDDQSIDPKQRWAAQPPDRTYPVATLYTIRNGGISPLQRSGVEAAIVVGVLHGHWRNTVLPRKHQVNRSVHQNIDRMCFTPGAVLHVEYDNLYRSLFNNYDRHLAVVEALARKSKGMIRGNCCRPRVCRMVVPPPTFWKNWSSPDSSNDFPSARRNETLSTNWSTRTPCLSNIV